MDKTKIDRFPRGEAWGAGAEIILKNWDEIPYRLRAAIIETLEGTHTRYGVRRHHLQLNDDHRMHHRKSGRQEGEVYFTKFDGSRWRRIPAVQAGKVLLSMKTASIWGRKSGYSHSQRRRVD